MKGIKVVSKRAILFVVGLFLGFTSHAYGKQNEAGNASTPLANSEQSAQHVVLISLDGFRHDYIELHDAKNLARIAKKGVRAQAMTPVYPANTFPNHISLVTGLLPKHHGIVNNRFYDKSRPTKEGYAQYQLGYGRMDSTWITAVPLWNLAEFHGLKAATFFGPSLMPEFQEHYRPITFIIPNTLIISSVLTKLFNG